MNYKIILDGKTVQNTDTKKEIIQNNINFNEDRGITPIQQKSEYSDILDSLNDDTPNPETRTSAIDMRTRFGSMQVPFFNRFESAVGLGIIDKNSIIVTRICKRNYISINGGGRSEIVDIVGRKREEESKLAGGGMIDRMKNNLFGGKE